MRIANVNDRAALVTGDTGSEVTVDLAEISEGRFGPVLADLYSNWEEFADWIRTVETADVASKGVALDRSALGAPSPTPRQVFAIGLNYRDHALEAGFDIPTALPPVFTKYVSSFSGPDSRVTIPTDGNVDWEAELVVVIGRTAHRISEANAWSHVAGLTVGQDVSERISQLRGPGAQFGLGKSFPGFSPQGPWLVTPDEFSDPDDLEVGCAVDDVEMQRSRTGNMIFPVSRLIADLSATVTLYPGDVVFTGTPAGVGVARDPQRFLKPGERLTTWIDGIGELHQQFVAEDGRRHG
ncbi:fumarylacetoacetate hydrolase family protein [Gordonia humi]|uniref:2-keto-4-pentenoate hydratase/2-oxohepta-3-ene-1,7-dioic acid hydratase in catechol pathway n=1 Tax=Gordonia humi TaxID=686429 RepID=A0A840F846_9ACTN|nr:fumarylacetoacetate hydrolase family protein [Gordonia humi]MBB4137749.1 2-keto-4-pentenoate hydratase/2-oxohepta-3-ene-1,7-dioic acid hydratase in catechol pathway [Gordonia humi]